MDTIKIKADLIKSAQTLSQPSTAAAEVFAKKSESLAANGNALLSARADIDSLVGATNIQMAHDNNRNFARFMNSMFMQFDPAVFVETVLWVFRAYRSHGFQTTYWPANLNIWVEMLKVEFDAATYDAIYPFYNWLLVNIPLFVLATDDDIQSVKPS